MTRKYIGLLLLMFALCGCAEEKQKIVVPVAGIPLNYMENKAEILTILSADFPKLKPNALDAIDSVPRLIFISSPARHRSYTINTIQLKDGSTRRVYDDKALPIGSGQSMLKFSDIGFLLSELDLQPTDNVLEIGTGNGYLAAIMSRLSAHIFGIDIIEQLIETGVQNLERFKISKTQVRLCRGDGLAPGITPAPPEKQKEFQLRACLNDGKNGMAGFAPYDVILVTATVDPAMLAPKTDADTDKQTLEDTENPPLTLEEQLRDLLSLLKPDGRLAIPLFNSDGDSIWHIYRWNGHQLQETASRPSSIPAAIITRG